MALLHQPLPILTLARRFNAPLHHAPHQRSIRNLQTKLFVLQELEILPLPQQQDLTNGNTTMVGHGKM